MLINIRANLNYWYKYSGATENIIIFAPLNFLWKVAKFSKYNIRLLGLAQGEYSFEYNLDNKFFQDIDDEEVGKGDVKVLLKLVVTPSAFDFSFDLKGIIQIPCNRCLDEMSQQIETQNRLVVKLGDEYSEESDEVIIIPRDEGEINIAWFLYEFVVLNIPIKHFHEPGKCNRFMNAKFRKHKAVDRNDIDDDTIDEDSSGYSEDDGDTSDNIIDPRWESLKGLSFEDN